MPPKSPFKYGKNKSEGISKKVHKAKNDSGFVISGKGSQSGVGDKAVASAAATGRSAAVASKSGKSFGVPLAFRKVTATKTKSTLAASRTTAASRATTGTVRAVARERIITSVMVPYQSTPKRTAVLVKQTRMASVLMPKKRNSVTTTPESRLVSPKGSHHKPLPIRKPTPRITSRKASPKPRTEETVAALPVKATPSSSPRVQPSSASQMSRRRRSYSHSLRRSVYTPAREPASQRRETRSSASSRDQTSSFVSSRSPATGDRSASNSRGTINSSTVSPATGATSRFHTPVAAAVTVNAGDYSDRASFSPRPIIATALLTPFRQHDDKSAASAPLRTSSDDVQLYTKQQQRDWDDEVTAWLHRPWKLCFMSALDGFNVRTANLRSAYQKTLRNKLSERVPFNVQVSLEEKQCFSRSTTTTDYVALTVTYSIPLDWDVQPPATANKGKRGKKEEPQEKKKKLYQCFMVKAQLKDTTARTAGMSWYPLLFYTGRETFHHSVTCWLQDSFGGQVSPRCLRSTALLWAAGLWYKQACGETEQPVTLTYTLEGLSSDGWQQHRRYPSLSKNRKRDINTLGLEMPAKEMRNLACCVVPAEGEAAVSAAHRDLLHVVVQQLLVSVTCLPMQALRLTGVTTACLAITKQGQVKVRCRQHLLGLLQWLLELHREDSLLDQVSTDLSQNLQEL